MAVALAGGYGDFGFFGPKPSMAQRTGLASGMMIGGTKMHDSIFMPKSIFHITPKLDFRQIFCNFLAGKLAKV